MCAIMSCMYAVMHLLIRCLTIPLHCCPMCSAELLSKFREKNIDFAAHSNTEDGGAVFLNLLGNLAFPLLLVGGLFLLSRRSGGAGGMGGPGGNNPLAFGTHGWLCC